MKVVVVDREPEETTQVVKALKASGCEPVVTSADKAPAATNGAMLALVGIANKHPASDLVGAMRKVAPNTAIVLFGKADDKNILEAYGAGCDGDISMPASAELLAARLWPHLKKIPGLHKAAGIAPSNPAAPVAGAPGLSSGTLNRLAQTASWVGAPKALAEAAGKFLVLDTGVAVVPESYAVNAAARIVMLNAEHQLELRVAVGADTAAAQSLAVHMFGPEGKDLAPDMLGELNNIFMGVMKTTMAGEALPFAAGLPEVIAGDEVLRPSSVYANQQAFALTVGDVRIIVNLGVRSQANQLVAPAALREGMVLCADIANARGVLMVARGTRLSLHMIEKIRQIVNPKLQVEVMAQ